MKNKNADIDADATFHQKVITATLGAQAQSLTGRVLKFVAPFDMEVLGVTTDTSAITGAPTLDVLAGSSSVLAAPIALGNNAAAAGTLHATRSRRKIAKGTALVINATTAAVTTITGLSVAVHYRACGLRGGLQ